MESMRKVIIAQMTVLAQSCAQGTSAEYRVPSAEYRVPSKETKTQRRKGRKEPAMESG